MAMTVEVLFRNVPEATYRQLWDECTTNPALAADVSTAIGSRPEERVHDVYTRVLTRVHRDTRNEQIFSSVSSLAELRPNRLAELSEAQILVRFYEAFSSQHVLNRPLSLQGDLFEKARAIADWMESELEKRWLATMDVLDLHNCGLTHLPRQIGLFTGLTRLNLQHNALEAIPREIGQCRALQTLDLSQNRLLLLPEEIGGCTALKNLRLGNNLLLNLPEGLGQCTALEHLILDHNMLRELPPQLARCTALRFLQISHNGFRALPDQVGQWTVLRTLYAAHNQITAVPAQLGQCTALEALDLSHNQITQTTEEIHQILPDRLRGEEHLRLGDNPQRRASGFWDCVMAGFSWLFSQLSALWQNLISCLRQ